MLAILCQFHERATNHTPVTQVLTSLHQIAHNAASRDEPREEHNLHQSAPDFSSSFSRPLTVATPSKGRRQDGRGSADEGASGRPLTKGRLCTVSDCKATKTFG